jgi:hypothetical protein
VCTSIFMSTWALNVCRRYNFKSDPRSIGAKVLLSANESSYVGMFSAILDAQLVIIELPDTGVRKFDQGTPHPSGA